MAVAAILKWRSRQQGSVSGADDTSSRSFKRSFAQSLMLRIEMVMASSREVECLKKITTSALPFFSPRQICFERKTDHGRVFLPRVGRKNDVPNSLSYRRIIDLKRNVYGIILSAGVPQSRIFPSWRKSIAVHSEPKDNSGRLFSPNESITIRSASIESARSLFDSRKAIALCVTPYRLRVEQIEMSILFRITNPESSTKHRPQFEIARGMIVMDTCTHNASRLPPQTCCAQFR